VHPRPSAPRAFPLKRIRFWLICLFFLCWGGAIAGRLFWLQIVRHQEFLARAEHQHMRNYDVAAQRGFLFDRNGSGLAMTVLADSIFADPTGVDDKQTAAHALAAIVHIDPDDADTSEERILNRLGNGKNFAWIARRVTPEQAAAIRAQNLAGIFFVKEFKRIYPADTLAAPVLGYVGPDDSGMAGLEAKFDALLHGKAGERSEALDAHQKTVGSTEIEPLAGRNLTLTIDNNIQYTVEQALERAMQRTEALNGTVVVEDVHTGQILALATRPTFNPNQVHKPSKLPISNTAVSNVYEPGSTFKLVTYSAALDQQLVQPGDMMDCSGGQINVAGAIIRDDKSDRGLGHATVAEALAHSSDVCAIKLALRLGPQRFNDYIRAFGFGTRSGIELPGETRGMLMPLNKWYASSIGYFAIGQGVAVTPLQLSAMVSTIANGGVYLAPHILIPDQTDAANQKPVTAQPVRPGEDLPNPLPQGAHRVISTMASAQMRNMMRGVVEEGTGKQARLNGYSAGGKTGTAQKIETVMVNGKAHSFYSKDAHIASFAGFAPVNNPVIAVAVIIDTPQHDYYGSSVSAPIFREVAQSVLEYIGVPHDTPLHAEDRGKQTLVSEDSGNRTTDNNLDAAYNDLPDDDPLRTQPPAEALTAHAPATPANTPANTPPTPTSAPQPTSRAVMLPDVKRVRVPQLTGLSVRKVIEQAGAAGLNVQISGSGICHQQTPEPGTMVPAGTHVQVRCGR
jgi:cell division protein FtsI (penicillin-binding protein 3)